MAWVKISEQTAVTATLDTPSTDVKFSPGGFVYPDGSAAQLIGWTLNFSQSVRIGVQILANPYPTEVSGTVAGGLSTDADAPNIPYQRISGALVMPHVDADQIIGGEEPATYLQYEPATINGAEQSIGYNIVVYVWQDQAATVSYNCDCDDDYPRTTLLEMRKRLMRRLGFSVQAANPPPGMADLIDDFIRNAQELLFRRYSVFRRERFYTWDLVPGTRFYDLDANADECTKRLDPRMVSWVGVSRGDDTWQPLICGIDPSVYTSNMSGIPTHFEIRQCIELWPAPSDAAWKLRIKGQFGLMPLEVGTDQTTVEPEAIFLLALANAKAHYGQPDAGNYASQLAAYVRDLVRGSHHTRRYLPGRNDARNAVRPIPVGGWPEDT
jgi:hypothetical protein